MRSNAIRAACAVLWAAAAQAAPRLTAEQARVIQLNGGFAAIVDVRPAGDYARGHIQGARSMPDAEVGGANWAKDGRTLVYCAEDPCPITEKALSRLRGLGYEKLAVLAGGYAAWPAKGYPVAVGAEKTRRPPLGRIAAKTARDGVAAGRLVAVDSRAAAQYALGRLPGAVSAPLEELSGPIAGIPLGAELVVYDLDAGRSRKAAETLQDAGYRVGELIGGVGAWIKKGYPLETR